MVESKRKEPAELRSHRWFGKGPLSFGRRSRMLQNGWGVEEFVGRPVIAIINTWSDLNTCHGNLKERAEKAMVDKASDFDYAKAQSELAEAVAQLHAIQRLRKMKQG